MEILEVLQRVISKLEELRIPYMVSGSLASSFHAFVRTTQDGDLAMAYLNQWARELHVEDLLEKALQEAGH